MSFACPISKLQAQVQVYLILHKCTRCEVGGSRNIYVCQGGGGSRHIFGLFYCVNSRNFNFPGPGPPPLHPFQIRAYCCPAVSQKLKTLFSPPLEKKIYTRPRKKKINLYFWNHSSTLHLILDLPRSRQRDTLSTQSLTVMVRQITLFLLVHAESFERVEVYAHCVRMLVSPNQIERPSCYITITHSLQ